MCNPIDHDWDIDPENTVEDRSEWDDTRTDEDYDEWAESYDRAYYNDADDYSYLIGDY